MKEIRSIKKEKNANGKTDRNKSVIITDDDIYYLLNNKNSLTKIVYERLISMFLNNELVPGQIFNRQQLADNLGVSVAPVLEAMVQLENDGFIESIPRKGTLVRSIRDQDIYERLYLRGALECAAARLYTGLPIRQNKDELLAYAEKIDGDELYSIVQMKNEVIFHASLVNLAGISILTREFLRASRIGMFSLANRANFFKEKKFQNHKELVIKLSKAEPDDAEKIIRKHIWSGNPMLSQNNPVQK